MAAKIKEDGGFSGECSGFGAAEGNGVGLEDLDEGRGGDFESGESVENTAPSRWIRRLWVSANWRMVSSSGME